MEAHIENALRAVARRCRADILTAIKNQPKPKHDPIITDLLDKHTKSIQALPPGTFPAKLWLVYFVRLIDREQRGEV